MYARKVEALQELEGLAQALAQARLIEVCYGDESHVCSEGHPYGYQFAGEEVRMEVGKGFRLNCRALIDRQSRLAC